MVIVNNTAMNIGVHVPFQINVFIFSGSIPRSGIAGSYGSSVFSFLQNLHSVCYSDCTNLHSHQQCTSCSLFSTFFICGPFDDSLTGVRSYLFVVLIFISLMISDTEHLFMFLLAIWISSLEKCLFTSSAHFLIGMFAFWCWVVWAIYVCRIWATYHSFEGFFSPNLLIS